MPLPSYMLSGIPQAAGGAPANMMLPAQAAVPATLSVQDMANLHAQGAATPMVAPQAYPPPEQSEGGLPTPVGVGGGAFATPPTPVSPITGLAPGGATFNEALGQFRDARMMGQQAQADFNQGIDQEQQALADQGAAQMDEAQVRADRGDAMGKVDAEREATASAYADKRAQLMAQFDKQNAVQLQKMQQAVDAADAAQVHDFWADKSTGARVLGIIAQALSGAANGLAGNPSAPTALDRIINDDLQRQMANQQNKRQVAAQQQGIYQSMLQATGNRLDAETAMYQAANNRISAMATSLADKFATPEANAQAKNIAAQMQQKNAQLLEKRSEMQQRIATQDANAALGEMGDAEKLGAMSSIVAGKSKSEGENTYYALPGAINGLDKARTTSGIYAKQVKAADDVTGYLATLEHAKEELNGPGGLDSFYQYAIDHDLAFAKGRSDAMLGLGKRLEGSEEAMANHMAPGYIKSYIGGDITKARLSLDSLQNAWGRVLLQSYRSANPKVALDYNAPIVGPVFQRVVTQEGRQTNVRQTQR